jgi:putative hemolysin
VAGILHVRDLFALHRKRQAGEHIDVRDILHSPLFINETIPLEELLREFQRTQMHMAMVRGSSGDLKGVVTMDDVLEELFGEME